MTLIGELDHSAIAVNDLILAERFYAEILGEILGGEITMRTPQTTEEVLRRFKTLREGKNANRETELVYRGATPHSSVRVGKAIIPFSLYQTHVQEPPPEQLRGTPRLAFHVTSEQVDQAVEVFRRHSIAFEGPVEHPAPSVIARSLYFKDPSSNFLELCCARA
jgi:catechol 2,3-dioxygenase-like lactoylglutathione lyase family enzyme